MGLMGTPPYVSALRRHIGNDLLLLPGVSVIILRESAQHGRQVLLVQRADTGAWTPITGIVDPDEEPHEAAIREAAEEASLAIHITRVLAVGKTQRIRYTSGDECQFIETVFAATPTSDSPPARVGDEENLRVRWFPVTQLPEMQPRFVHAVRLACGDHPTQLGLSPASPGS